MIFERRWLDELPPFSFEDAAMAASRSSASGRKAAVKKTVAKKAVAKTSAAKKKITTAKPAREKKIIAAPSAESDAMEKPPKPPRTRVSDRRSAVDRLDDPPPATGLALIARVTSAIERELNKIEVIVGGHRIKPADRTEGERRARTLASLARTLSAVARLREQHQEKAEDDDDDTVPRDLDELRETLARRLEKLLNDPTQPPDCEPEPA